MDISHMIIGLGYKLQQPRSLLLTLLNFLIQFDRSYSSRSSGQTTKVHQQKSEEPLFAVPFVFHLKNTRRTSEWHTQEKQRLQAFFPCKIANNSVKINAIQHILLTSNYSYKNFFPQMLHSQEQLREFDKH